MSRSFGHLFFVLAIAFGLVLPQQCQGQEFDDLDQSCFYVANKFERDFSISQIKNIDNENLISNANRFAGLKGRTKLGDFNDPFKLVTGHAKTVQGKYDLSRYIAKNQDDAEVLDEPSSSSCEFENLFATCHLESNHNSLLIQHPKEDPSFAFKASNLPADIAFLNPGHTGLQPSSPYPALIESDYMESDSATNLPIPSEHLRQQSSVFWWLPINLRSDANTNFRESQSKGCPILDAMNRFNQVVSTPPQQPELMDQGTIDYWEYYANLDRFDMDAETNAIIEGFVSQWQISRWLVEKTRKISTPIMDWAEYIFVDNAIDLIGQLERLNHVVQPIADTPKTPAWGWNEYRDLAIGYYMIATNLSNDPLFQDPGCWFYGTSNEIEIMLCGTPWLSVWYDARMNLEYRFESAKQKESEKVDQLRTMADALNAVGSRLQRWSWQMYDLAESKETDIARQSQLFQLR